MFKEFKEKTIKISILGIQVRVSSLPKNKSKN